MAIDVYEELGRDETLVTSIPPALAAWFFRARGRLGTTAPFARFDPYGETTLSADTGDVASFASAVNRTRTALDSADWDALAPLPYDEELEVELGRDEITQLLDNVLAAARRVDAAEGRLVFRGD